jgi:hypothetical protein
MVLAMGACLAAAAYCGSYAAILFDRYVTEEAEPGFMVFGAILLVITVASLAAFAALGLWLLRRLASRTARL